MTQKKRKREKGEKKKMYIKTTLENNQKNELYLTIHRKNTKMAGGVSLNTSSLKNKYCIHNASIKGAVCCKCYSNTMQRMYKNLNKSLLKNEWLKHEVLTQKDAYNIALKIDGVISAFNGEFFRFESFGDIETETQLINYFNIAKYLININNLLPVGLWTKNIKILTSLYLKSPQLKPDKMQVNVSSLFTNKKINIDNLICKSWINRTFTVYDLNYLIVKYKGSYFKANNHINCDLQCNTCLKCYKSNNIKEIAELLKSDAKKLQRELFFEEQAFNNDI